MSEWQPIETAPAFIERAADRVAELEAELIKTQELAIDRGNKLLAANAELSGVHAGTHAIVEVEPTEDMINAGIGHSYISSIYRAMIKASKESQ